MRKLFAVIMDGDSQIRAVIDSSKASILDIEDILQSSDFTQDWSVYDKKPLLDLDGVSAMVEQVEAEES